MKNEFSDSSHDKQKIMNSEVSNNSINSQIPETRETILINKKNLKIVYKIKAIPSTGILAQKSRFVQSL